jgi:hypothetical protein
MPSKPTDFPFFDGTDENALRLLFSKLEYYLKNITSVLGIKNSNEIYCDMPVLIDIFNRIEMRRIYFHIFHKVEMGELNEGCLLCFWVLKFMPFKHAGFSNVALNVKIAACIFLNMSTYVASKENKTVNKRAEVINDLMYAFQYRDLSKEALMILAKSFIKNK